MTPKWLEIAQKEVGVKEVVGEADNLRIIEYHACTTLRAKDDSVPWCSAFVNFCMKEANIKGTGLANARSWLDWGVELGYPALGCIVVLRRGLPPAGHVGFFIGEDDYYISLLGGNQSDAVKISKFPKSDVLGYFWPTKGIK